jgi:hypothetical protein
MTDRIKEINLEIRKLLKSKTNPKKLESLQAELKELLINRRLPPVIYKAVTKKERKPRKQKEKSNLVDFQKAKASKSAEEFTDSIKTGELYKELRPKKEKKKS